MERWEELIETIQLPSPGQKVYIWGAGNTSVLNHQGMLREGLYEAFGVSAFLDRKLAGTELFGYPVLRPEVLKEEHCDVFVLISTTNGRVFSEIAALCAEWNIPCCLMDAAVLKLKQQEFLRAAELLDPRSQAIYHKVLANRAVAGEADEELYAGESYFGLSEFCRSRADDVILDCGAYVGDSAERFLWRMEQFKQYIAVEPDEGNFHAMQRRFQRLREEWNLPEGKLIALHAGVDAVSSAKAVETRVGGLGSVMCEGSSGSEVPFWAIDDFAKEKYTFLKADIESYEYRMLLGTRNTIQQYRPRLAICIYHNMVDMYSIPELVHAINPDYRLSVRQHSYGYEETVLYAW